MFRSTLLLLLLCATLLGDRTGKPTKLAIGYVLEGAPQYQIADLKIAFSQIVKRYGKSDNILVDIRYYDSGAEAVKDFERGVIDSLSGTSYLWARHYEPLLRHSAQLYIAKKGDELYEREMFLMRRGIRAAGRGSTVLLPSGDYNARLFLLKETLKDRGCRPEAYYNVAVAKKASVAIYRLFFNKADYAVVSETAWNLALEMNPRILERVAVVKVSPKVFIYGAGGYSRRLAPSTLAHIRRANERLRESLMGRQLLSMLQIKGFTYTRKESFEPFIGYIRSIRELERKLPRKGRP